MSKAETLIDPLRDLKHDSLGEATLTGNYECKPVSHLLAPYTQKDLP
jgi:hypothetical protein